MTATLIVFIFAVVSLVLVRRLPAHPRRVVAVVSAVMVFAAAALALVTQGWRWQFTPLALAAVVALAAAAWSVAHGPAGSPSRARLWWRLLRGALTVGVCGLLVAGGLALWALPVLRFPPPSGPAAVGTTTVEWQDADRPEPGDQRSNGSTLRGRAAVVPGRAGVRRPALLVSRPGPPGG